MIYQDFNRAIEYDYNLHVGFKCDYDWHRMTVRFCIILLAWLNFMSFIGPTPGVFFLLISVI